MSCHTRNNLDEDCIIHCETEIVGYFDSDGELSYCLRFGGDAPKSTFIGLLEMAKADMLAADLEDEED